MVVKSVACHRTQAVWVFPVAGKQEVLSLVGFHCLRLRFLWLLSANVYLLSKLFPDNERFVHLILKFIKLRWCCGSRIGRCLAVRRVNNLYSWLLLLCLINMENGPWDCDTLEQRRENLGLFLIIPWISILEDPLSVQKKTFSDLVGRHGLCMSLPLSASANGCGY